MKILAINPGGVSTKVALYEDEKLLWSEDIQHSGDELSLFNTVLEQFEFRKKTILSLLEKKGESLKNINACVGRGGVFKPLPAGTYRVNDKMIADIKNGNVRADHPSNLGAMLAKAIASQGGVEAFIVDPVSVDEFEDVARISGLPGIERLSLLHALNVRATAFRAAAKIGKRLEYIDLVVAHLGSGFSICPIKRGRIIDVNNANDGGPFSPQRAGSLPVTQLVKLAFSGKYKTAKELNNVLTKKGGFTAYLGTHDLREVEKRIARGDKEAKLIFDAMIYQIKKEIAAMAAVLDGEVDGIILTGGLAYSEKLTKELERCINWIAPVHIFPGENELESLAMGVMRVLKKEEKAKEY